MALIQWPVGVPGVTYQSSQESGDNTIRTQNDYPHAKVRLRYSINVRHTTCILRMKGPARIIFDDWFENTLNSGIEIFEMADPGNGLQYDWVFVGGMTIVETRMNWHQSDFVLERRGLSA